MITGSWGQWMKLGFGAIALMKKHPEAAPLLKRIINDDVLLLLPLANDALDLWQSVFPPDAKPADDAITHTEVIEKIRSGNLTADEKAVMDRASQTFGG